MLIHERAPAVPAMAADSSSALGNSCMVRGVQPQGARGRARPGNPGAAAPSGPQGAGPAVDGLVPFRAQPRCSPPVFL